ncbi:MAG: hypothetical protein WA004_16550 [Saprospiraceae bacterium]
MNRGGSWNNNAENCRVANRNNNWPENRNNNIGFRLVLQLTGKPDGYRGTDGCPVPGYQDKKAAKGCRKWRYW